MPEISLNPAVSVHIAEGSSLDALARLSPHQALVQLSLLVERRLAASTPFADWFARAIDPCGPDGVEELDELFVSYVAFCRHTDVALTERLTFPRFGRSLTARGLEHAKSSDGRPVRYGCRLKDWSAACSSDPTRADLADFLDRCCTRGAQLRTRASLLHAAYEVWAAQNGRAQMGMKRFRGAMLAAGFKSVASNGRWWIGLSDQSLSGDETPVPPAEGGNGILPGLEG